MQVEYKMLCKKLGKIIERQGKLVEIYTKRLPLGHNMIKFRHNGPQMYRQKAC